MPRERLSISALPAWMGLNNASFTNVEVRSIENKGYSLIAKKDSADIGESPLITIPHSLVLNAEAVEQYAKEDRNFRRLLDACGHKSPRHDILLFLLVQLVLSKSSSTRAGLPNPWTEYIKFLDDKIPVPTLWKESERLLLTGTSLEPALNAKLLALADEFDELREKSSDIECWNAVFWDSRLVHLTDWILVDAWYRSRVLELPRFGPSLVPCIDMANHSGKANVYYEEHSEDEVVLLMRPGCDFKEGDEITISYGEKSAAEFLFSYGFVDEPCVLARSLRLPLSPISGDPLGEAKSHILNGSPAVEIREVDGRTEWASCFAYLMCLNEEDGLEFRVLQVSDGSRELKMFWRDEDVTDKASSFESLISNHDRCDVFRLRVNMVIYQRLQDQLERISLPAPDQDGEADEVDASNAANARKLRSIEKEVLARTIATLEDEREHLLALDSVTSYLEAMAISENGPDDDQDDEEDFS